MSRSSRESLQPTAAPDTRESLAVSDELDGDKCSTDASSLAAASSSPSRDTPPRQSYQREQTPTLYSSLMTDSLTLTAVFTPDENGWTMAQLAEWPAVVSCGRTLEEAREMLLDAAQEMIASYREEGREVPIGGGHVEALTIDLAA
jgi:predicted RNase H-like HicB family nuclease